MQLLIVFLFLLFSILIVFRKPALAYMMGLSIYYNLGGYFARYAFGLPGFFRIQDLGLLIAFLAGLRVASANAL